MAEPTREQYAELHDRIVAALPVDPDDGTCVIGYGAEGFPLWGAPTQVARAIEGVFRQMDLQVVPGAEFDRLTHDVERLREALKVCEEALHSTAILRGTPLEPGGDLILHAAQQASAAWWTSWQRGQQERDDAGLGALKETSEQGEGT